MGSQLHKFLKEVIWGMKEGSLIRSIGSFSEFRSVSEEEHECISRLFQTPFGTLGPGLVILGSY